MPAARTPRFSRYALLFALPMFFLRAARRFTPRRHARRAFSLFAACRRYFRAAAFSPLPRAAPDDAVPLHSSTRRH